MASRIPAITLHNGGKMPSVGLGTFQGHDDEMRQVLNAALECGYRHIDTATVYKNEAEIGDVLHEWLSSGRVAREELFVVTKLPMTGNRSGDVGRCLQDSLDKLRLSYVDLYLIHSPVGMKANSKGVLDLETNHEEIYKAMEEQVDAGKAKAIGLSNFNSKQIERILKVCRIKPANLQVEVHVYHQQKALRELCRAFDIPVCAYCPLGAPHAAEGSDEYPILLQHPVVTSMAKRLGRTPAQVLLRFLIQNNLVVIPKSTNQKRVKENFNVFDFELSSEDVASLETLDRKGDGRVIDFKSLFEGIENHPEWPFGIPY
ncbi:aldo-keto reductase family 1 member A1-like [Penaeus chinensis]|uniref:aldo-keto reductase family 1 member A1-like n=1 Tax=Penaeus chinensis TaxID=139456 RepID=UPI001FB65228|nr:aldo-keto reductase family 1 member A1-like [Penaeus chinensis]XP_047482645.1 aldo-keto reductase family 1 member A1-like [Penaeus chinensis]